MAQAACDEGRPLPGKEGLDRVEREELAQRRLQGRQLRMVCRVHAESDATCGAPRVRAELAEQGTLIARTRVARLMRQAQLHGVSRRRGFVVTTRRNACQRPMLDLVKWTSKSDGR